MNGLNITTIEMHTCGEPVRIIESGLPQIQGNTILEKLKYIKDNLDYIRKLVILEPRGHYDMFGMIPVTPDVHEATLAAIFIHNEGYATMCGHVLISFGRYAVDKGLVPNPVSPETRVVIQCPCGPVEVFVEYKEGKTGGVRFNSVPSYVFAKDVEVDVAGYGNVTSDIVFGGAFYAILPAERMGLDINTSPIEDVKRAAGNLKAVLTKTLKLSHPVDDALAFLFGIILTEGNDHTNGLSEKRSIVVFADNQVDRSPCGSGTTARVALHVARGDVKLNQSQTFISRTGGRLKARAVKEVKFGPYDAHIVEISGRGYYTGSCCFTLEDGDDLGKGFLIK